MFVHDNHGINRSATIVVAYLMKKYKRRYKAALKEVKLKRPIIDIPLGFIE